MGIDEQDVAPGEVGHGVVDEPGEFDPVTAEERPSWRLDSGRLDAQELASNTAPFTTQSGNYRDNFDRDGNGNIQSWERGDADADGKLSPKELVDLHNFRRQLFARHLYVLAMTLVDPVPLPATGGLTNAKYVEKTEKRARQLAQWAINVVDFRDSDNCMTGFEYDTEPFDGWGRDNSGIFLLIDGDLGTPADVYGADNKPGGAVGSVQSDVWWAWYGALSDQNY